MPLYKVKGIQNGCSSYMGISLLSVSGNIYARVLNERMLKITERSIGTKQGGFRKGRGCAGQIFLRRMIVEKYLKEVINLSAAFIPITRNIS